ncbi:hypothetical protein MBLNU457_1866t1 [Dothideomycetes sp. NU457]
MVRRNLLSSFTVRRVNASTFAITEDDKYGEHPIIYAKIHPKAPVIILSDTGCDASSKRSKDAKYTHLRQLLEDCPVEANNNEPLNPSSSRAYIVICSHCHFDHIGGISQFKDASIVASAAGMDFVLSDLPEHSLCKFIGIETPMYLVSCWAADSTRLFWSPQLGAISDMPSVSLSDDDGPPDIHFTNLGITIYNTPGHTPDSLAFYDHAERHIYIGDSFYELAPPSRQDIVYRGPIIFPKEGNWITYLESMNHLLREMRTLNQQRDDGVPRVKLSAGHSTVGEDAEDLLSGILWEFHAIIDGKVPVVSEERFRGEIYYLWHTDKSNLSSDTTISADNLETRIIFCGKFTNTTPSNTTYLATSLNQSQSLIYEEHNSHTQAPPQLNQPTSKVAMSNRNPAVQNLYTQIRPLLPTDLTTVTEATIFDLIKDLPIEDAPRKQRKLAIRRHRANSIWGMVQAEIYPGWTWRRFREGRVNYGRERSTGNIEQ